MAEQTTRLQVRGDAASALRYRWLEKYLDEDWNWSAPWRDSPDFDFIPSRPGRYDLQVDIADAGEDVPRIKKWLGTIEVGGRLVERIGYTPLATVLPVGTPIHFVVRPRGTIPMEALEFRLWDLLPTNRIVCDWQSWPLPAFVCEHPRETGLQIDVRLKEAPAIQELHWLNDFVFHDGPTTHAANLLRCLMANHFDELDREKKVEGLAQELHMVAMLLDAEHQGRPLSTQIKHLSSTPIVTKVDMLGQHRIRVKLLGGEEIDIHLDTRTLQVVKSPIHLDVSLSAFPEYGVVLDALRTKPESIRIAAIMTRAVYVGYYYGTQPTSATLDSIESTVASCQDRAVLLHDLLRFVNVHSSFVELGHAESGHILIQINLPGTGPWLLDPTVGQLYEMAGRQISEKPIVEPIRLPPAHRLPHLDLSTFVKKGASVRIYDVCVVGVVPMVPVAPLLTTRPAERQQP